MHCLYVQAMRTTLLCKGVIPQRQKTNHCQRMTGNEDKGTAMHRRSWIGLCGAVTAAMPVGSSLLATIVRSLPWHALRGQGTELLKVLTLFYVAAAASELFLQNLGGNQESYSVRDKTVDLGYHLQGSALSS